MGRIYSEQNRGDFKINVDLKISAKLKDKIGDRHENK
jgi:hypothetical protein